LFGRKFKGITEGNEETRHKGNQENLNFQVADISHDLAFFMPFHSLPRCLFSQMLKKGPSKGPLLFQLQPRLLPTNG
jgi:hypothetical protein